MTTLMATQLFIYGTLKRGESRSAAMADQRYVAKARTAPRYRLLDCGDYPGLIEAADGEGVAVEGEVWEIDDACLLRLDQVEGVDERLFVRREVDLQKRDGPVEAYFFLGDSTGLTDCGKRWER